MNNIQFRIVFCSSAAPNLLYVLHKPVFHNACFQSSPSSEPAKSKTNEHPACNFHNTKIETEKDQIWLTLPQKTKIATHISPIETKKAGTSSSPP